MNRTIKDAAVKRYHYDSNDQLRQQLGDFVAAYNFARRLKTLRGLTPCEAICKAWADQPARFTSNPPHQLPGPTCRSRCRNGQMIVPASGVAVGSLRFRRDEAELS